MTVRVMVTNGNNVHAPDYHAEITAEKIISAAKNAVISIAAGSQHAGVARDIRKKIEAALLKHHQAVHDHEQSELASKGFAHCDCEIDAHPHVDETLLDEIAAAVEGSPLHEHFMNPTIRAGILAELHHETRSQMNVHRHVFRRADELAKRPRLVK